MYSIEVIRAMNDRATKKASQENLPLYIAKYNGDTEVRTCEKLGDYIPEGWKKINSYFVDNSGFGSETEPALTFRQFLSKVKKGFGYAIGEVGQFQVYINEYEKI